MSRRYRIFVLLIVAGLLAWLNLRPTIDVGLVRAIDRPVTGRASSETLEPVRRIVPASVKEPLERPMLEPAVRDPFAVELPAPVVAPKAPAMPPPAHMVVSAPVVPSMPSFSLRFAGRMRTPEGADVVYVADGDNSMAITVGQNLPNGYRVEAITAKAVELRYLPSNVMTRLELPEPPKYETR